MNEYIVDYATTEDDTSKVTIWADSKEEAESKLKREYHDVDYMIQARKV